jgi:excisionase family DNA binding protein
VKLTVREAARLLNVAETRIYRWIEDDEIPFIMIHHRPLFHRVELLEWAIAMQLPIETDLYERTPGEPFSTALERGGGRRCETNLADAAGELPIASQLDRTTIRTVVATRESEMFVCRAPDGIAIPKARSPVICAGVPAVVCLLWPGPGGWTIDSLAARAVFVILAPTLHEHLKLLSRLSRALHAPPFRDAVQRGAPFELVLERARGWEQSLAS